MRLQATGETCYECQASCWQLSHSEMGQIKAQVLVPAEMQAARQVQVVRHEQRLMAETGTGLHNAWLLLEVRHA